MDRTQLKQLCESCGYDHAAIRQKLNEYFETDEGKTVIAKAPMAMVYNGIAIPEQDGLPGEKVSRQKTTKDLAIDLLMQEVGEWLKQQQ